MTIFDNTLDADGALIVGAGLAGLFTALKLAPRPVTVLSPKPLGTGASSAWAQGGVAAAMGEGDSPHAHAQDTEMAGAGIVDHGTAEGVTAEAVARIEDLARWGTPFDRDDFGNFELGREAAHSANRIVKVEGDRAGWAIMQAIIAEVRRTPSIRVVEGITALSLARDNGRIVGVYCRRLGDRYSEPIYIRARATILAAGGLGGLYAVTTNPPGVRGEGAILVNDLGERFMPAIHPDAELAPRDIVARANFRQIKAGRRVFLDTRAVLGADILTRFPTVSKYCHDAGIDPVNGMIPVTPAAHFHMGGVKVDERGRSSLPGLWVCGEASCTGLHGANRLASNSLLEAVVFGARIAEDIGGLEPTRNLAPFDGIEWNEAEGNKAEEVLRNTIAVQELRRIMGDLVGVERDEAGLRAALRQIAHLEATAEQVTSAFLNMTTSATLVAAAALQRTESRGGHFRLDFPEPSEDWEHHTEMTLGEALAIRAGA
ncbi:MAG: L-aspartate oxidase [Devosia sp.]